MTPTKTPQKRPNSGNVPIYIVLGALLLLALSLRMYGIDWDNGKLFHPDERAILLKVWEINLPVPVNFSQLLDPNNSTINPRWFAYGSFPLYLLKVCAHLLSFLKSELSGSDLRLVGRTISALFDTGTVFLVFLLGSMLYSRRTGLLAAAFAAFSVLQIQSAHFVTSDPILTFFIVAAVLSGVYVAQAGTKRASVLMGLAVGLGLATKISIAPIFITVIAAHLLYLLRAPTGEVSPSRSIEDRAVRAFDGLILTVGVAAVIFLLAQPYALIDRDKFVADTKEQSEMVTRTRDYPYTRQYEDTTPYIYQIFQTTNWGLGAPLGVLSWLGLGFITLRAAVKRRTSDMLILSWALPYFILAGAFQVKFMRYMLPLTPFMAIMGAEMLWAWSRTLRTDSPRTLHKLAPAITASIVLILSALYSIAFLSIYSRSHTAVQLSQWINQNVPPGATIAKEHWEEGLPDMGRYRTVDLKMYDPDTPEKLQDIVSTISKSDYIVLFSNRLYGSIPRLPERYPMSTEYYRQLFSGELGYSLETYSSSYPSLLGIALKDDTFSRPGLPVPISAAEALPEAILSPGYADESFTVYDHPLVMLFKKTESFSEDKLKNTLASSLGSASKLEGLLFPSQEAFAVSRFQGTGLELFPPDGLGNRFPLLSLLATVEFIGLLVLPLSLLVTSHLPDKGYVLAKLIGILAVSYVPWLLSSLKVLPFTRETSVQTLLAISLLSALVLWRRRRELREIIRGNWKIFLLEELVFLLAFLFLYQVRLHNPDLWHPWRGGEKPMDFAYLNAVVRSQYMPPYDPWFAGGYINYYYFGQVIIGALIKLIGIVPSVAYNLAVPLLFALSAATCFSIGYNMAAFAPSRLKKTHVLLPPIAAGLASVFLVLILGNFDGAAQLAESLQKAGGLKLDSTIPGLSGLSAWVIGVFKVLTGGVVDLTPFDYWRSSRMMPPTPSITEFPYFTFLLADLHAHLISIPFALGIILIFLTIAALPSNASLSGNLILLFIAGWVLGAVRWTNSWDYPTYLFLGLITIALREYLVQAADKVMLALSISLRYIAFVGPSLLLFLPLSMSYELFYSGIQPTPETTNVGQYLGIHGLFLFIVSTFLLVRLWDRAGKMGTTRAIAIYIRYWWKAPKVTSLYKRLSEDERLPLISAALPFSLTLGATLLLSIGMLISVTAALLTILGISTFASILLSLKQPKSAAAAAESFAGCLLLMAALIGLGVEVIAIQGDLGRMNTVFKFYLQAWVLYSIGSAYALWWLAARLLHPGPRSMVPPLNRRRGTWTMTLALLVAGAAVYPIAAIPARTSDRFTQLPPTNDGMAFMTDSVYQDEHGPIELKWDYKAIQWIEANLAGTPVIMEGITPIYRWGSRISVYTGLPTVIGWDWHQKQQRWRYEWMVDERIADVNKAYTTADEAEALSVLKKYGVQFIVIGQLEKLYYPARGIDKFNDMAHRGILASVYQNQDVQIFKVMG
ncbi:MAG: phospholipid carrier-dependent glycosyltransferase [Dehalococcoidia bacterium]|nr:phospholipid carrier-dependent glycosyltransferase [Dehalococcoidia bacterium]